jgi:serine phosphatase RsbU (regulator of sigma subunit)/DNA-binding NarL/FixJ family response regulator
MDIESFRILVVEDSPADARLVQEALRQSQTSRFELHVVGRLAEAIAFLDEGEVDAILLDLNLPDSGGLETLARLVRRKVDAPILILTGSDDEEMALQAVQQGAADFLVKQQEQARSLGRFLRAAIERHRIHRELALKSRQLSSSEARFRNIIENDADGIVIVDEGGSMRFANPAARRLFGRGAEQLLGRPFPFALSPGEVSEHTIAGPDGGGVPVEMRTVAIEWEGRKAHLASLRDISERMERERAILQNEAMVRIAQDIQADLFPPRDPTVPGFDISGMSHPAEATGGDYFDFIPMLYQYVGILIGDVSGHGLGPALLMAETRAYVRALAQTQTDVGLMLTLANRLLVEDTAYDKFVTLFFARLNPFTRTLDYASAAQHGYIVDASGEDLMLDSTSIPLGLVKERVVPCAPPITLEPGDAVFLFTDGVPDVMNRNGQVFGVERAVDLVRRNRYKPAREILEILYGELLNWAEGRAPDDDVTAVIVKTEG